MEAETNMEGIVNSRIMAFLNYVGNGSGRGIARVVNEWV